MNNNNIDGFLSRLQGVRKNPNGWTALCPAHDDHNPSLHIAKGDDDKVLLNCKAGCTTQEVVSSMGLQMKNLFPDNGNGSKGDWVQPSNPPVKSATNGKKKLKKQEFGKPTIQYEYKTLDGQIANIKQRYEDPKGFSISHIENGKKVPGKSDTDVPYRLPEWYTKGGTIFILGGEKDCDRAWEVGYDATCQLTGEGSWNKDYNQYFKGKDVIVIGDNDENRPEDE